MIRVLSISCSLVAIASADLPSAEVSAERYQPLWENSLFTSNRAELPRPSELGNFALGGVSELANGYFVVLIDKRSPEVRIVIGPDDDSGFKVLRVDWSDQNWKKTSVVISDGKSTGSVGFDPSILLRAESREMIRTPRPRVSRTPK